MNWKNLKSVNASFDAPLLFSRERQRYQYLFFTVELMVHDNYLYLSTATTKPLWSKKSEIKRAIPRINGIIKT